MHRLAHPDGLLLRALPDHPAAARPVRDAAPHPGLDRRSGARQGRLGQRHGGRRGRSAEHQGLSGTYGDQDDDDEHDAPPRRSASPALARRSASRRRPWRPSGAGVAAAPELELRRPVRPLRRHAAAARLQGLPGGLLQLPFGLTCWPSATSPRRAGPSSPKAQVKALAANTRSRTAPTMSGEMFERPAAPGGPHSLALPEQAGRAAANGGAAPPDFSVLAKARTYERGFPWFLFDIFTQFQEQGADYITALLNGYKEPAAGRRAAGGQVLQQVLPRPHHRDAAAAQRRAGGVSEDRGRQAAGSRDRRPVFQGRAGLPDVGGRAASRGSARDRLQAHALPARLRQPALLHEEEDLVDGRRPR